MRRCERISLLLDSTNHVELWNQVCRNCEILRGRRIYGIKYSVIARFCVNNFIFDKIYAKLYNSRYKIAKKI